MIKLCTLNMTRFRQYISSVGAALALAGSPAWACGDSPPADPGYRDATACQWLELYGEEGLLFQVIRKNRRVGEYRTQFIPTDDGLEVISSMELKIPILWVYDYQYRYTGRELWRDGTLETLSVTVDDNGDSESFSLRRDGERLTGEGPGGAVDLPLPVWATHHYDASITAQSVVFNTLTGRMNQVKVKQAGTEQVATAGNNRLATRYTYEGELHDTDAWYDQQGRWVKLRFKGSDGSTIELHCVRCGGEVSS